MNQLSFFGYLLKLSTCTYFFYVHTIDHFREAIHRPDFSFWMYGAAAEGSHHQKKINFGISPKRGRGSLTESQPP